MSARTFARRFKQETGTTPHRWLLHQRILSAQQLLEKSDRPIDWIAESVGLQTAATLREHFRRMLKTTPTAYRRAFFVMGPPGRTTKSASPSRSSTAGGSSTATPPIPIA